MSQDIDVLEHITVAFDEAHRQHRRIISLRIGKDLEAAFRAQAGAAYSDGHYFGVPVSFDAIDPETVVWESEPL